MKKGLFIFIVLFFIAAAAFAGTTYWFGLRAEQQYYEALRQASQLTYVHLTDAGYQRGFLTSQARTEVLIPSLGGGSRMASGDQGQEVLGLVLTHDIRHGPLPLAKSPNGERQTKPVLAIIETTVELDPESRERLQNALGALPEWVAPKIYTTVSLKGGGETRLFVPVFEETVGKDEKVAVNWQGLTANMAFASDLKSLKGTLNAPGLEAVGDNVQIKMVGMESTFDMAEGVSGLFLGDATFDLAQFEFAAKSDEESKQFSVRGLNMKTSSQALTDTVNYSLTLQANQVVTNGTQHGPGSYQLELRKLDAATLAKFQQVLREIHSETPHRTSQDINQMMLARYAALLSDLMKKSPEIELNYLSFKTTDGDFLGKAKIVVNGTNAAAFSNPLLILNAVTAHAEFSITDRLLQRIVASTCRKEVEEAVSQANQGAVSSDEVEVLARTKAEERLEALVAQNILIHEGGRYRASADYQLGQVILNSRLITLQDLFQQG